MKTKKILLALATILTTFSFAAEGASNPGKLKDGTVRYSSGNSPVSYGESTFTKGQPSTIGSGTDEYTEKTMTIKFPSILDGKVGDTMSTSVKIDGQKPGPVTLKIPVKNTGDYYMFATQNGPKTKHSFTKGDSIINKDSDNITSIIPLENIESNEPIFFYMIPKDKFASSDDVSLTPSELQKYLVRDKDGNVEYLRPTVSANFAKGYKDNGDVASKYLGKGFVEVLNLPRYAEYGEIKAQTKTGDGGDGKDYASDRANWFVSGATVYDYLHHKGDDMTPYLKDIDPATLKDWKDKLGISGGAGTGSSSGSTGSITIGGNTGTADVNLGDTMSIKGDDKNIISEITDKNIVIKLKDDIEVNSAKINKQILDTDDGKLATNKEYVDRKVNTPITFTGDTGTVNATLGKTINIVGDNKNIGVDISNDTIKVGLKDNITVENATINRTILDTDNGKTAVNKEYVDKKIKNIQVKGIDRLSAGVANAIATASMPLTLQNGKHNNLGFGIGYFGGHAAVSVGYLRGFSKDNIQLKVDSAFNTLGEFSAGAGMGFSF